MEKVKKAHNFKDRSGTVINNWTIISHSHTINRIAYYRCKCKCGFKTVRRICPIIHGLTKSCGCLNRKNHTTHGLSKTKPYRSWKSIRHRCLNENCSAWKNYGGRGIKICDEWINSFEAFYKHIGDPPTLKHSVDRIDNDGNYAPGNVRWATAKEQANNKRNSKKYLPSKPKE